MTIMRPLIRGLFLAAACVGGLSAVPAYAAPEDVAVLKSYIGSYRGRGTTDNDGQQESVVCRLSLADADGPKVVLRDTRCAVAGANVTFNGTIAFNESTDRYETAITSDAAFSGNAVGRRRGNDNQFSVSDDRTGPDGSLTLVATINKSGGQISVDFDVTDNATGGRTRARVPLVKQ